MPEDSFMVIAHRGGEAYAPENTFAAFAQTAAYGIGWAETDLRLCRSGHIVLIHDEGVERTTGGRGRVRELSFVELRELDAGSWFDEKFYDQRILSLRQLFEHADPALNFLLEIKEPGRLEAQLVETIAAGDMRGRIVCSSLYPEALEKIKSLDPGLEVGYIALDPDEEKIARALRMKAHHIAFRPRALSAALVASCARQGLRVRATLVREGAQMHRLVAAGVCGMVMSDPRPLRDYLEELTHREP